MMTADLIKINDRIIDIDKLPAETRRQIRKLAVVSTYVDGEKERLKVENIDVDKYVKLWLKKYESLSTIELYYNSIRMFIAFMTETGRHPLSAGAEDVDSFVDSLKDKYSANSIRGYVSACSSFYSMMRRYKHISINPFHGAPLPKKEYKKAVHQDHKKTLPVMSEAEYNTIVKTLEDNISLKGKTAPILNARSGALLLLPAVHFMRTYGLRVGALESISISTDEKYFIFLTKGQKSGRKALLKETLELLQAVNLDKKKPFSNYKTGAVKKAMSRLTERLYKAGSLRHPYSAHDFRHLFAVSHYMKHKDVVLLKAELGHASINITDIYLQSIGVV